MALGMRRAVFSLVMEQMSFKRTVSWHRTETKENKQEAALTESGEACSPGTSSQRKQTTGYVLLNCYGTSSEITWLSPLFQRL